MTEYIRFSYMETTFVDAADWRHVAKRKRLFLAPACETPLLALSPLINRLFLPLA